MSSLDEPAGARLERPRAGEEAGLLSTFVVGVTVLGSVLLTLGKSPLSLVALGVVALTYLLALRMTTRSRRSPRMKGIPAPDRESSARPTSYPRPHADATTRKWVRVRRTGKITRRSKKSGSHITTDFDSSVAGRTSRSRERRTKG